MNRVVLKWNVLNHALIGTFHQPKSTAAFEQKDLAVLILNSGFVPRAGNSDLSVHIANALAEIGVPVLRFDLPGLGDSAGVMPATGKQYWSEVVAGRNDEFVWHLICMIRERLGIGKIILGGLCAATVPAIRIANRKDSCVVGAILLEPEFRLPDPVSTDSTNSGILTWTQRLMRLSRKAIHFHEWSYFLEKPRNTASLFVGPRILALRALRLFDNKRRMPTDTNLPLVREWRHMLSKGIGSLVIIADSAKSRHYAHRIINTFPGNFQKDVCLMTAPDTGHQLIYAGDFVASAVVVWITQFSVSTVITKKDQTS